ncbi:PAS domain S-box-containing protein/diguanylate cyclase (GGDEF) domain-containing protein [Noviherbaspirillum humi]|uniref:PAS domain S-box-containing protein/diguanylate cyclase (GGDEF) domain-containing protein n=1 Tax=Noviherbaspirillum humi TaxID=1688639 RepID=A0A239IGS2_9BURK|nr:EAL domain-containing protein [Noviherbaspirillum humi]SNS92797.1 PAS domain S-box-containing protein/diguanylate cyclase (GGDEF) domain-containing protein [Noviherbaspirillum humi]
MINAISRLIGRLTVGRKLALIYLLDLTTVIFISAILINEKFIAIDFARKEMLGSRYITAVHDNLLALSRKQALTVDGAASITPDGESLASTMEGAEAAFGNGMGTADLNRRLVLALRVMDKAVTEADPPFQAARALLLRIGNQSNLILDPDLDSYYTMSLTVLRFPDLLETLNSVSRLAGQLAQAPAAQRASLQTDFLILEGRVDATLRAIESDYGEAFAASKPILQQRLQPSRQALLEAVGRFNRQSQTIAGLRPGEADTAQLLELHRASLAALGTAWSEADEALRDLLQARIDDAFHRMRMHLGTAVLLLVVILGLVYFVARQIAQPIRRLASVADSVSRSGDYTLRAEWSSSDELGRLVQGFNGMLQQLDQQRQLQQELVAQASAAEAQRELIDAIPIPMLVTAVPHHEILHANHAARAWVQAGGDPWQRGLDAESRARFFQALSDLGVVNEFEALWSGGPLPTWALLSARCIDYQGKTAVLTTFTPIGQIKQMEQRLVLWAKVFESSSESVVVLDANGCIMIVNPAFCRSSGYAVTELQGRKPHFLISERNPESLFEQVRHSTAARGHWQGEILIERKNGEPYPAWLVMNAVRDHRGEISHFIAISLDISERKANEQRIHFLAHHDVLTSLPNRSLCMERLQLSIQQTRRTGGKLAVLFVDLDRFKNINDSLGHHVGDGLLCSVARRLSGAVRAGDTVSRQGGDEFVIILNNAQSVEEIGKIVEQRLIPAIRQPHEVEGARLYVSCSVGVSIFPDDGQDIDTLTRHADAAMYQAKSQGRNNAQFFTPALNEKVMRHLHLETDLRHAADRNELMLYYQPRICARSGRLAGVESLVRWRHPREGLISPAQFIPLAEESGLIIGVGAWIMREALRQHLAWQAEGLGLIPVSINLSAIQLKDPGLAELLEGLLMEMPVDAANIEFELTESLLMENVDATIRMLEDIKALGFRLSIDDFGTGYSSLNYLHRFPIDRLKIDRSFVQQMHMASHNMAITRAIIGLGHTLGLDVVAEGVEREAEASFLREAGCDELQGFYFGRPMAAADFPAWLLEFQAMATA